MEATDIGNCRATRENAPTATRSDVPTFYLLDRPIAFHRCLVAVAGSVTAALLLSQALYWHKRNRREEGWWFKTREEWTQETGMSRYEQESARKRLRALGLLQEELRGVPAQLWYRLDEVRLLEALARCGDGTDSGPSPAGGKPASQLVENPPTSWRKTRQPVGGKPTNKLAENPPTIPFNTETTTEITAETTTTAPPADPPRRTDGLRLPQPAGGSGGKIENAKPIPLVFDGPLASLSEAQRERAKRIVGALDPDTAQQVLDDWGQAIKTNSIRKSRWAWLDGVTRRAHAGTFTPTADTAERRQAEERLRKAQEASRRRGAVPPLPAPENRPNGRPDGLKRLLQAVSPHRARTAE